MVKVTVKVRVMVTVMVKVTVKVMVKVKVRVRVRVMVMVKVRVMVRVMVSIEKGKCMSIRDRLLKEQSNAGVFAIIGGERLAGKSTLAGTLPGKTLLLQANILETGSQSALTLAERNGGQLDVISFRDYGDLLEIMESPELFEYDNLYVDGLSSITDMVYESKEFEKISKKNTWDGFALISKATRGYLLKAKRLSDKGLNVFTTLAYKATLDPNGNVSKITPDIKGNATLGTMVKLCPTVLSLRQTVVEGQGLQRVLMTTSDGVYPGRLDGMLDDEHEVYYDANLAIVLEKINTFKGVK